jgi:hypothetical protein
MSALKGIEFHNIQSMSGSENGNEENRENVIRIPQIIIYAKR